MRTQVFQDFDAFAESVRDVDSKMLLRNPKKRVWSTGSVDLGRIDVQIGKLGSGNIAQGQLRADGYMIYLPLTKGIQYTANGQELNQESFAVLEPGCEFCISTKVAHDWCVAFIPTEMLGADVNRSQPATCRVTKPHPKAAGQFRRTLLQVFASAKETSQFETSLAARNAAEELRTIADLVVGDMLPAEPHREGRPRVSRQELIRRAMGLVEQQAGKQVSVEDLVAATSVSERTLRTAFNEYFGLGPDRYLQLRHLHLVHRKLKAADSEAVTVSQLLVENGEWAFGRFASRYRKLFGELPSETLRKKG